MTENIDKMERNAGVVVQPRRAMSGRYSDIAMSFSIITIPMMLLPAVLLGLVFHNRVTYSGVPFENLRPDGLQDEPGIYYVNLSGTFLVFVASWASSVAPMLASFVLALASYPISKKYLDHAQDQVPEGWLTPYQLALTLIFLNGGGFGALWRWLKYLGGWKGKREPQAKPLTSAASVAIIATALGTMVFLADTWLHVTTKTVSFLQVEPVQTAANYSLGLTPACTKGNNSLALEYANTQPCALNPRASITFLVNGSTSLQVLNNVSDSMVVLTYQSGTPFTYLGIPTSDTVSRRDYTAKTFGMQTQCKPISNECNLNPLIGASTPFKCTDAFQGDLASYTWWETYFSSSTMESNDTIEGIQNPYYFGIATWVTSVVDSLTSENGTSLPEVITPVHGGTAFVLFCTVSMYDIEYDSVNGTVTRFVTTASNASVANVWQAPMANTPLGEPYLEQAANLAVLSTSAQEIADKIALSYSTVALAIGAQAVIPGPALAAQERSSFLVSRVPAAPLFALVISNLLFAVMGIVLAIVALATSGGNVREIQARLSIVGLVADRFESRRGAGGVEKMEELFEESEGQGSLRVAIDQGNGVGYGYRLWPKSG